MTPWKIAAMATSALFVLSACDAPTQTTSTPNTSPAITPEFAAKNKFQTSTYSEAGKTYVIYRKRDPLARADKIVTQVKSGRPFTGTPADDAEVQNMLRNAYRKLGLCEDGLHPGLLSIGYGSFVAGDVPTWSAYVRCSDKKQANI